MSPGCTLSTMAGRAAPCRCQPSVLVQDIVLWHERLGLSADEICAEYDLELADVYAALSYYFDHRSEIDESIREGEALVAELRKTLPSKLVAKLRGLNPDGRKD